MESALEKPHFQELHSGIKTPAKETILTPRLYTTDFEAMARIDISSKEEELKAILEELRTDYNRFVFVRGEEFNQSWNKIEGKTRCLFVDGEARRLFVEFLERSCTSEFAGFLLYKELGRRLKDKNPILAECFNLLSRDEARHAGFINKAMSDLNMSLDLGFLSKSRKYTFFKPKFIFYATYLSEKIGYWRYMTIYRHLQQHSEGQIYPFFRIFENWCQDENRHGDFLAAIMKAQTNILNGWKARLWCRFFLLSVFATMYLNDFKCSGFYASIGLDVREYDRYVIEKTNETAGRVFPVILDVENPEFYEHLEQCVSNNAQLRGIDNSNTPKFLKVLRKIPVYASNVQEFISLYLMKPISVKHLQNTVR